MGILLGFILALVCVTFLTLPFLRERRVANAREFEEQPEPARQRAVIYDEIKMLELEREVGRVEGKEYEDRLYQLRLQAAAIIREDDRLTKFHGEQDLALEEEISSVRKAITAGYEGQGDQQACPNCNAVVGIPLSQCPECGTFLAEAGT